MKTIPVNLTMITVKCSKCNVTSTIPFEHFCTYNPGICSTCGESYNFTEAVEVVEMTLGKAYVLYTDNKENKGKTFDDFYDYVGVPKECRSDFATACLLKQAQRVINEEPSS